MTGYIFIGSLILRDNRNGEEGSRCEGELPFFGFGDDVLWKNKAFFAILMEDRKS